MDKMEIEMMVINILSLFLFLCYFIVSFGYILKRKGKAFIYWYDYTLLLLYFIVYFIINVVNSSSMSEPVIIIEEFTLPKFSFVINFSAVVGSFCMNIMKGIAYSLSATTLMKFHREKEDLNDDQTINHLMKRSLIKFISNTHFIFLFIVCLIQIFLVFVFIFKLYPKVFTDENEIGQAKMYIIIQLICFGLSHIVMCILKERHCSLVNYNYFNNDIVIERIFNNTKDQTVYIIEHLLSKNVFDVVLNLPVFISNLCIIKGSTEPMIYHTIIIYFIWIIIYGAFLLTIDRDNKIQLPKASLILYSFKLFSFNMNNKSKRKRIRLGRDIIIRNITNEDTKLSFSQIQIDSSFSHRSTSSFCIVPINQIEDDYKEEKEYLPCNYFLIFKLLHCYFKKNEKVYLNVEQSLEDNGDPFRNFSKGDSIKPILTSNNITDKISRISRYSLTNHEKLHSSVKFTMDNFMNSMEEKTCKDEFNRYLMKDSNGNRIENAEFRIEALFIDVFFELFPFYQISINDILKSLDISENKDLYRYFFEKKSEDKAFNSYYSKDLFLSFEIYDQNFIPFNSLKEFIGAYKTYLIEKLNVFSFSFLPLIIGIFNVTYLSYSKIVVLFKNPIAFSPLISFNCWINYEFSSEKAIVKKSAKVNEIADLNEIEVKNNLSLGDDEYVDAIKTIKSDLAFLKASHFDLSFTLNLFVLNDEKKNSSMTMFNKENSIEIDNFGSDDKTKDKHQMMNNSSTHFMQAVRDTNLFNDSVTNHAKHLKKYFGSDVVSLLEKLYENHVVENKYVFKIYFSQLFNCKKENQFLTSDVIDKGNKQYCKL